MSPPSPGPEILDSGPDRSPTGWFAERPRLTRAALALLVAIGLVAAVVVHRTSGPQLPRLTAASTTPGTDAESDASWRADPLGRPTDDRVTVTVHAELTFDAIPDGGLDLLGLHAPGVIAQGPPLHLDRPGPAPVLLAGTVDCATVAAEPDPSSVGLQARTRSAGREKAGLIPAAGLAAGLAAATDSVCGSWIARRELTVTDVAPAVPTGAGPPQLSVTVVNRGPHDAVLLTWPPADLTVPMQRTPLAAGASTVLRLPPGPADCDVVTQALTSPDSILSGSFFGLAGSAARSVVRGGTPSEGTALTPLVMTPSAVRPAAAALVPGCDVVKDPLLSLAPGGARYDPAARVVTLDVLIDVTAGWVRSIDVPPIMSSDADPYLPRWSATQRWTPDAAGRVRIALSYRVPSTACTDPAVRGLPGGIPPLSIDQHAVIRGADRIFRDEQLQQLPGVGFALARLSCR